MGPTRILVTGGTGFVGSEILEVLHEKHPDWMLFSLDIKPATQPKPYVEYLTGDATVEADAEAAVHAAAADAVVATVGIVPSINDRYSRRMQDPVYRTNIDGTVNVMAAARAAGARAFVFTSSCCAVVDNLRHQYPNIDETWRTSPTGSTVYGESKARAEVEVLAANDPSGARGPRPGTPFLTCCLRPSVLFGPEDYQLIPSIYHCIAKWETPFIVGAGTNLWDVTHVVNIADAHVLAVENLLGANPTAAGEAIFISNDEPIPFRDFCLEVWKNFDHYPPFEVTVPEPAARAVAAVSDFLAGWFGLPSTLSVGSVGDAVAMRYCSGDKARRILGYKPRIGIEDGIRESCEVDLCPLGLA